MFTHDLDFGVIVATTGASSPSVIQARTLDILPEALGDRIISVLRVHDPELSRGAIVTLDAGTERVRILPIR